MLGTVTTLLNILYDCIPTSAVTWIQTRSSVCFMTTSRTPKLWSLKITFWTACTRLTAHRADGTHFNVRMFRVFIVCLCSHQTPSWPESEWSRRWTARCTAVTGETRPTVYINFLFALLLRMANKPLLLPQQPVWQTLLVRFLSLTHWIQTDIFYWTEGY